MENLIALIAATAVLVAIPGPNVAVIVANAIRHGRRAALMTVAGSMVGVGFQLVLVAVGVAAVVALAAGILTWLKWAGVGYLVVLGIRAWNEAASDLGEVQAVNRNCPRVFWHGVGVAVLNPKTLLFNAAFLPQFVGTGSDASLQMLLVSMVFLTVIGIGDTLWALFASAARPLLLRYGRLRNRITGGFLVSAGVGLALARR